MCKGAQARQSRAPPRLSGLGSVHRADGKASGGEAGAVLQLGEADDDDAAHRGHLVQVPHDLDLDAVHLQDVLLAGRGVGPLLGGDGGVVGFRRLTGVGAVRPRLLQQP